MQQNNMVMSKWDELSMAEKAEMIGVAVRNGITNLNDIRDRYNEFAEGGSKEEVVEDNTDSQYINIYEGGGYTSSDSIRKRIAKHEGAAMTGAKDPLSGKFLKNRSFEDEDRSFYRALPESIRDKVLANQELADNLYSYSYNVGAGNFKKRVVPALEKFYQGKAMIKDIEDSMWASGDSKLRGLRIRRAQEREGVRNALSPKMPDLVEQPVSTAVFNPYIPQAEHTVIAPVMVPDEDSYITAHRLTEAEEKRQKFQERIEAINNFNRLLQMTSLDSTAVPSFMPTTGNVFLDSMMELTKAEGGSIHIKPENRGKFTALKERTGHSATWFKEHGTPAQKKMATFALNARHWKHGLGGNLFDGESQPTQHMNVSYGKPYYDYNLPNHPLTRNATAFPEIIITPDSKKSPAEKAVLERERRRNNDTYFGIGTYNAKADREQTELEKITNQKAWENSAEKRALDFAQAATTGIGIGTDIVSGLPIYSSLKGARVLSKAETPMDYAEGTLWISPMLSNTYNTVKPVITQAIDNTLAQVQYLGREMGNPFRVAESIYNYGRRRPISFTEKQAAAKRMEDFIRSPEYIQKQKDAGLSDSEITNFQSMVLRRLNGGNFPAYTMKRKTDGVSWVLPKPFGGIYIREGIPSSDFLNVFDHEVAHYSTVNFGTADNELFGWLNKESPIVTEKILKHNINSVPYRPETDAPKIRTARGLSPNTKLLDYYRNEQELRSNAYAMLQEAQRRGISVDDLVDQYTMQSTGEIFGHAPASLRYLNYAYTPEDIKKFIKKFLSVSVPISFGTKTYNQYAE